MARTPKPDLDALSGGNMDNLEYLKNLQNAGLLQTYLADGTLTERMEKAVTAYQKQMESLQNMGLNRQEARETACSHIQVAPR